MNIGEIARVTDASASAQQRKPARERRDATTGTAFAAQVAAFYPYPRMTVDVPPRASVGTEGRVGAASPSPTLSRRRQGRDA